MLEKNWVNHLRNLKFYKEAAFRSFSLLPWDLPAEQFPPGCVSAPGRRGWWILAPSLQKRMNEPQPISRQVTCSTPSSLLFGRTSSGRVPGESGRWRQHCVVLCQVLCAVCAAVGKSTDSGARFLGSTPSSPTSNLWVLRPVCELLSVP